MRVAANITALRTARGLSQAEMARRLNGRLDRALYRRVESGDRRIDMDDLYAIARALDTSVVALLSSAADAAQEFDHARAEWLELERLRELEQRLLRLIDETRPTDGEH